MNIKICPICVAVSGTWLLIQIGVYGGLLMANNWILVAAIAMGGTVVGIAYQKQSLFWKSIVITIGMPVAYLFVTHINPLVIVLEIIILLIFAYMFFLKQGSTRNYNVRDLETKLKNCC
ncbi:MAG: hypothetical protein AAB795_04205 [Patescibacteria group bacterium]